MYRIELQVSPRELGQQIQDGQTLADANVREGDIWGAAARDYSGVMHHPTIRHDASFREGPI